MQFGADFDALIERFSPDPKSPIALAVSGGSDSLALLLLAEAWAKHRGRRLHVFTVDHKLRAEAAAEAMAVAEICRDLNLPHKTLIWDTPKPGQNAARSARYKLLCQASQVIGARTLLVGHTLNDIVETALIRRRRGVRDASIVGPVLASAAPIWPEGRGLTLIRPLIQQGREDLRDWLVSQGQAWMEDPSNAHLAYERVRVRQTLARHKTLAKHAEAQVIRLIEERHERDIAFGEQLSEVTAHTDGLIEVAESLISARLLTILARCASGSDRDARASALTEMLSVLAVPGDRQTLGGAWFQKTTTGLLIGRDPGDVAAHADEEVFDGRFVAAPDAGLPEPEAQAFLVRQSAPPGSAWREIISERLAHLALCYQTPRLSPVQT